MFSDKVAEAAVAGQLKHRHPNSQAWPSSSAYSAVIPGIVRINEGLHRFYPGAQLFSFCENALRWKEASQLVGKLASKM